ncbi:hypothetical protein V8G54_000319 [Vigna mungo]|uniref:Uncharacterized protein n=1 Tax=Vigna mungo TaxID=3915 RepID=A0AAQ3P6A5_VIGMU
MEVHSHVVVAGLTAAFDAFVGSIGVRRICNKQWIVQGIFFHTRGTSSKRNIKNLTGLKCFGVGNAIQSEEDLLSGAKLLSNSLHRAPRRHQVRIVHHSVPIHRIAATRQRNIKRVPGGDVILVRYLIRRRDLWILHQTPKRRRRYVVQRVPLFYLIKWNPVRESSPVAAPARQRHLHNLVGPHHVALCGVAREVVGA